MQEFKQFVRGFWGYTAARLRALILLLRQDKGLSSRPFSAARGTQESLRASARPGWTRMIPFIGLVVLSLVLLGWAGVETLRLVNGPGPAVAEPGTQDDPYRIVISRIPNEAGYARLLLDEIDGLLTRQGLQGLVQVEYSSQIYQTREAALAAGRVKNAALVVWVNPPASSNTNEPSRLRLLVMDNPGWQREMQVFTGDLAILPLEADLAGQSIAISNTPGSVARLLVSFSYLRRSDVADYQQATLLLEEAAYESAQEVQANPKLDRLRQNTALYYTLLGRIYSMAGDSNLAGASIRTALEYAPENLETLVAAGNLLFRQGNLEQASAHYQSAASSYLGQYGLGLIAFQTGRFSEATAYFEQALSLAEAALGNNPSLMRIQYAISLASYSAGDMVKARARLALVCDAELVAPELRDLACAYAPLAETSVVMISRPNGTAVPLYTLTPLPSPTNSTIFGLALFPTATRARPVYVTPTLAPGSLLNPTATATKPKFATPVATQFVFRTATPIPMATFTATPFVPIPTSTFAPTLTPAPPTLTYTPYPTNTPKPKPTRKPPKPSDTPIPTATNTPIPTNTPVPTATDTPVPTNTPVPTATSTDTPVPPPTAVPATSIPPSPTNTPVPPPTATDVPTEPLAPTAIAATSAPATETPTAEVVPTQETPPTP